jgi:hypothetical protein
LLSVKQRWCYALESKVNHLLGIFNKMGELAIHAHYDELLHSVLKVSIYQGKRPWRY